ncbi:hypothetical protein 2 [Hubei diptera virus 12]|uniref:hypothetical protein 2 n=1 Tax=Hubei diptera virus 12 TaxID=1922873 RepID=UPI00090A077B|nr:hypothetical protein 2 [Hubei diptera virus 12]APG75808.1 hypothetical protein 2 [Hubei diptera virus 12]
MEARNCFSSLSWTIPEDFCTFTHYLRALDRLEMSSSPGYPYMRRAPTNRDLFKVDDVGNKNSDVVLIFWDIVRRRLEELGDADPIRLFIKQEPHKQKKLDDGRFRLISSVSVVDQIIDHMLFAEMNDQMTQNWIRNPIKIGWTPVKGGWRAFPPGKRVAVDKSHWDWTVSLWMLDCVLQLRGELCVTRGELFDKWLLLAKYRYSELFDGPLFITSGGVLLRQKVPGVQKSGCVNTLADNSLMQWILHARVMLEHGLNPHDVDMWVMGDDTSQSAIVKDYIDWLGEYCVVKESQIAPEFCGFRFMEAGRVEPLYKGKHAFNLLHMDDKYATDIANSYSLLYHRSTHRDWMRNLFISMGINIYPSYYLDTIYDGVE